MLQLEVEFWNPLQGQMYHHKVTCYTIENRYWGNVLFTMINLSSIKFMTKLGNLGGQRQTLPLTYRIGSMIFLSQPLFTFRANARVEKLFKVYWIVFCFRLLM